MNDKINVSVVESKYNEIVDEKILYDVGQSSSMKCSNPNCTKPAVYILDDSKDLSDGYDIYCNGKEIICSQSRDCNHGFKVSLIITK